MARKKIRIGTDCSGIEAPMQAFMRLGIPYHHVFSCDVDKYVKKVVTSIYQPDEFYDDLMSRDNTQAPKVDLYIAGFPCQAFSMAGNRKGFDDVRGSVFFGVADYIKQAQPDVFILENVKGLLSHDRPKKVKSGHGNTMKTILDILSGDGGSINGQSYISSYDDGLGYHVYYDVLNTKEHGVAQNRERLFIVGFKENRPFKFPEKEELKTVLNDYLQDEVDEKFYLSQEAIDGFIRHADRHEEAGNGFGWEPTDGEVIGNTLQTNTQGSRPSDNFVMVKTATEEGWEPAEEGDSINTTAKGSSTRRGRVGKKVAQTLDTGCNQAVLSYTRDKDGKVIKRNIKDEANTIHASTGSEGNTDQFVVNDKDLFSELQEEAKKGELKKAGQLKGKHESSGRVYDPEGSAPTITSKTGGGHEPYILENVKIRKLTPRECFRLQDFPDSFFDEVQGLGISNTQLYKMAGNSMTVRVMEKILRQIYD